MESNIGYITNIIVLHNLPLKKYELRYLVTFYGK